MRDEGVLFEGLRLGSTQAFAELLREDDAAVRRLARLYVPQEQVAPLVREAWAVALPGLDMFTWHTTLRAWLTGILVSHGRAARTPAAPGPVAPPRAPAGTGAALPWVSLGWSAFWSDDSYGVLEGALAARSLDEREVLWLLDVEGWPWREVLDTLGLTEEQGAALRDRGRAALADVVEAHVLRTHGSEVHGSQVPSGQATAVGADADRLAGVATLLHALRPVAEVPAADPALLRTFTAWRRRRGVRAWRRWWWELDRARRRPRRRDGGPVVAGRARGAQPSSRVPTTSPDSSPVGTNPSRR